MPNFHIFTLHAQTNLTQIKWSWKAINFLLIKRLGQFYWYTWCRFHQRFIHAFFVRKFERRAKNVDQIDSKSRYQALLMTRTDNRCQFHQHLYVRIFRRNVVLAAFSSYDLALVKNSYEKCARKMLMKSTAGLIYRLLSNYLQVIFPRFLVSREVQKDYKKIFSLKKD